MPIISNYNGTALKNQQTLQHIKKKKNKKREIYQMES